MSSLTSPPSVDFSPNYFFKHYSSFLHQPSTSHLAPHASITYVPSLVHIVGDPQTILRHFNAQARVLRRRRPDRALTCTVGSSATALLLSNNDLHEPLYPSESESASSSSSYRSYSSTNTSTSRIAVIDVESSLEFVGRPDSLDFYSPDTNLLHAGGPYLPGVDGSSLEGKSVTFPSLHIVEFDADNKISCVRIYWDQASLLKQTHLFNPSILPVINSLPIRESADQTRLIVKSTSDRINNYNSSDHTSISRRANQRPYLANVKNNSACASRDLSPSISLFGGNTDQPSRDSAYSGPRSSARPRPRDLESILSGYDDDPVNDDGNAPRARQSRTDDCETGPHPVLLGGVEKIPDLRAGFGKKYGPIRVFDALAEDEHGNPVSHDSNSESTEKSGVKTNPMKYQHFEFGHGEDAPSVHRSRNPGENGSSDDSLRHEISHNNRHGSQWDFSDFTQPEKVKPRVRNQDIRHFSWSDDEDEPAPAKVLGVSGQNDRTSYKEGDNLRKSHYGGGKPRPDAQTHFEFADDGGSTVERKNGYPRARVHKEGLKLYTDPVSHMMDGDGDTRFDQSKRSNIIMDNTTSGSGLGRSQISAGNPNSRSHTPSVASSTIVSDRNQELVHHFEMTDTSPAHNMDFPETQNLPIRSKPNYRGRGEVDESRSESVMSTNSCGKTTGQKTLRVNDSMNSSWCFYDENAALRDDARSLNGPDSATSIPKPKPTTFTRTTRKDLHHTLNLFDGDD